MTPGLSLPVCQGDHLECSGGDVVTLTTAIIRYLHTTLSLSHNSPTNTHIDHKCPGSDGVLQQPLTLGQVPHGLYGQLYSKILHWRLINNSEDQVELTVVWLRTELRKEMVS